MKSALAIGVSCFALSATPAISQDKIANPTSLSVTNDQASQNAVSEIVVTASRQRQESVQSAPVAVAVLTGAMTEALRQPNIAALSSSIPNLTVVPANAAPGLAVVSLRGFSTVFSDISAEPGVAAYVDGVYQTIQPGSFLDLFDIQSLEVLRGPQGTLLGKNAPAGAIMVNRTRPTGELGLKARIEYGTRNLVQAQALVNVPIIPGILAGKIFVMRRVRDNYVENIAFPRRDTGGEKRGTIRGALLFTPNDNMKFYLTADYGADRSRSATNRNVSGPLTRTCTLFKLCEIDIGSVGVTRADFTPPIRQDDYSTTLVGDIDLGAVAIKSTTGYRNYKSVNSIDLDGTQLPILHAFDNRIHLESISEEFRLNSVDGAGLDLDGRLNWVLGLYYAHSKGDANQAIYAFGGASSTNQLQKSTRNSYAAFGSADIKVADKLSLTLGARRSRDEVVHGFVLPFTSSYPIANFNAPTPFSYERAAFNNTSVEGGFQYRFTPDKMAYFRYSQGYRGGGFNGFPTKLSGEAVAPETSRAFEGGIKTEWLDKRLRLNATIFTTKFYNLQRPAVIASSTGLSSVTASALARTRGIELETIIAPVRNLTIRANGGYLEANYSDFIVPLGNGLSKDLSGQTLPFAPKYTYQASAEYTIDLSGVADGNLSKITLNASVDGRTSFNLTSSNSAFGIQPGYASINGAITLYGRNDNVSVNVYVNDLLDKRWLSGVADIPGTSSSVVDNIGRTLGVALQVAF